MTKNHHQQNLQRYFVLINSYQLSTFSSGPEAERSGHRTFLLGLVAQLQEASGNKPIRHDPRRQSANDLQPQPGAVHKQANLWKDGKTCVRCAERGQRRALKNADTNATGRVKRIVFGYTVCQMPLCFEKRGSECWKEHLQAVITYTSDNSGAATS